MTEFADFPDQPDAFKDFPHQPTRGKKRPGPPTKYAEDMMSQYLGLDKKPKPPKPPRGSVFPLDVEPLPEADAPLAAPRAGLTVAAGMKMFIPSGYAGLFLGAVEPSEKRELDIPGLPDPSGSIRWDWDRAGRAVEEIGGRIPSILAGEGKAEEELVETAMKPISAVDKGSAFYGDWVQKNWPDRDEADAMGALTKTIVEGAVYIALPFLARAKYKAAVKKRNIKEAKKIVDQAKVDNPEFGEKLKDLRYEQKEMDKEIPGIVKNPKEAFEIQKIISDPGPAKARYEAKTKRARKVDVKTEKILAKYRKRGNVLEKSESYKSFKKANPAQAEHLYSAAPGILAGLDVDEQGNYTFDPYRAVMAMTTMGVAYGIGSRIGITTRIKKGVGRGRFLRNVLGRGKLRARDPVSDVLMNLDSKVITPEWDLSISPHEAKMFADNMKWLEPTITNERFGLRYNYDPAKDLFVGNKKLGTSNEAFPYGRNSWEKGGCGRAEYINANKLFGESAFGMADQACYGGACYAGRTAYVQRDIAGSSARVSTNLEPTVGEIGIGPSLIKGKKKFRKAQDIRLGIDTDGSAWLANEKVMDAILKAEPRTVTVYSSGYHTPPKPHPLSQRAIVNVTVSGWHPLPETLHRLKWAKIARDNGWNVILREVTAHPDKFANPAETARYNRIHHALQNTDFFIMEQPLHRGAAYGEPISRTPACCQAKNKVHTCDGCEVAEGAGKGFQLYYGIGETPAEKVFPAVKDYKGVQEPKGTTLGMGPGEKVYEGVKRAIKKPWEMSARSKEWADLSIKEVDRAAFGFAREDIKTLKPEELNIKWHDDIKAVERYVIEKSGMSRKEWAKTVDLSEPIDVTYETLRGEKKPKFYIDDGHHRYLAAKELGKSLNINLEIRDKPHKAIVKKALSEGKPVPPEVLKDYPDLKPKKPTAKFIGFDEPPGKKPYPLYNIEGGPRHGSTVTVPTLKELGIPVPKTPKEGTTLGFGPAGHIQKMYDTLVKKKKSKVPLRDNKYAGSVNVEKTPQEFTEFQKEVSALAPKKTQTWDETGKLSKEILTDYKKSARVLTKAKRGEGLTAAEMEAGSQINVNAISRLKEIAETGTPEQFNERINNYVNDVFKPLSDAKSEVGRALNIQKKEISVNRIANAFAKLKKDLNARQLKEFKELNFENPLEVKRFLDRLPDPKLKDYFYEYWYNAILSGIPTHVVNIASNTGWAAFQLAVHKPMKALVDAPLAVLKGRQRKYYLNETIPAIAGYMRAFKKGAKGAKEMAFEGKVTEFENKWEMEVGKSTVGAFERSPHAALRKVAPALTVPTKALRAMDVWANTMAYDAEIAALARRAANKKGLKGTERKSFERKLIENPTEEMRKDAAHFAKHLTFTDDPGKFTEWIIKGRDIVPGGRLLVPFVNTIANLTKRGIEMTPGVGLLLSRGQSMPSILAKQIQGSILGYYLLQKAQEGELIGAGPKTKEGRELMYKQGKKPWSIKIGDTWYQFRRIEPFNTVIASVAIAYEAIKNAKDDATRTEIFGTMVEGLMENLIDSSYLQGVTNALDRHGQRRGMVQRTMASFVPYSSFWRSINRAYEVASTGKTLVRDTKSREFLEGLLKAGSQVIPGLSDYAPPRLNVWGEEIPIEGGVFRQWLPYKWSKEKTDATDKVFEELGNYPGLPKQTVTIKGKKVRLPDDIYKNYCLAYGHKAKQKLDAIIARPGFAKKRKELKIKQLNEMMNMIRAGELGRAKREYRKRRR